MKPGDKVKIIDSNGPYANDYKHLIGKTDTIKVAAPPYYKLENIILPTGMFWNEDELKKI